MTTPLKTAKDIPDIPKEATLEDVIQNVNEVISELNFLSKKLSFKNFDGQIIENISFSAGETKTLYHALGATPRYRVILRQEGNGVLDDIPSGWNNFHVQMKNNGAVSVKATIFLVRE